MNLSAALGVDLNELRLTAHRLLIDEQADISSFLIEPRVRLKLLPNSIDIAAAGSYCLNCSVGRGIVVFIIERAQNTASATMSI